MASDKETIDFDGIDRACAAAAAVTPCCFCGQPLHPYYVSDRDANGRTAHFRCSEPHWRSGTWVMAPMPQMAEYEEGDDGRAWEVINVLRWAGRGRW